MSRFRKKSIKKISGKTGKTILILSLVLLAACAGMAGIDAYLTDADKAVNSFFVDDNEIVIEEEFEKPVKGEKTVKKPIAKNIGITECYVRAKVILSDSRVEDYFEYYYNDLSGFNTENWTEEDDGWMYYDSILKANGETSPIFTHIKLFENIPDIYLGFTIDVVFESVQSNDFGNAKDAFKAISK